MARYYFGLISGFGFEPFLTAGFGLGLDLALLFEAAFVFSFDFGAISKASSQPCTLTCAGKRHGSSGRKLTIRILKTHPRGQELSACTVASRMQTPARIAVVQNIL